MSAPGASRTLVVEQLRKRHTKRLSDLRRRSNGRLFRRPFDLGNEGPVHACAVSQLLLRELLFGTVFPDTFGEALFDLHRQQRPAKQSFDLQATHLVSR